MEEPCLEEGVLHSQSCSDPKTAQPWPTAVLLWALVSLIATGNVLRSSTCNCKIREESPVCHGGILGFLGTQEGQGLPGRPEGGCFLWIGSVPSL